MTTSNDGSKGKIAVRDLMEVKFGDLTFSAPNNLQQPSLVIARKGDKIIWQQELKIPEYNTHDFEKDIVMSEYFISKMTVSVGNEHSPSRLRVTVGEGINAGTYILNLDNGELVDVQIISPPPAK